MVVLEFSISTLRMKLYYLSIYTSSSINMIPLGFSWFGVVITQMELCQQTIRRDLSGGRMPSSF
jgi:hypothetical protein